MPSFQRYQTQNTSYSRVPFCIHFYGEQWQFDRMYQRICGFTFKKSVSMHAIFFIIKELIVSQQFLNPFIFKHKRHTQNDNVEKLEVKVKSRSYI